MANDDTELQAVLARRALPLDPAAPDFGALLERIGNARVVLVGEASHGTHEFYALRAALTRHLIETRGFSAVAVEADWPDAFRVNRYVRGDCDDADANAALGGFERFPTWMWRNRDVLAFVVWLRAYNDAHERKAGFYGLDLYSLQTSMDEVLRYLQQHDPDAATRARYRYSCFDHYGEDPQAYGYAASYGLGKSCEDAVVAQLTELRRMQPARDDNDEERFATEQNARLVRNAERYYRSMFGSRSESWNLRDTHMMQTLDALMQRDGVQKIVVWAHNSHLGDASATEVSQQGEINLGQLVREQYGKEVVLVGFSTYEGTVTAASDWDEPAHRKRVRPGLPGSWEAAFHATGRAAFQLPLDRDAPAELALPRLQRAIGVIYRPDTERLSHYYHARLSHQFDWMLHIDRTTALEPLEPGERWQAGEPPETFPSGL